MTEAVDPHLRETYLAGTLDALARRGRTAHAGQSHGVSDRARITYEYTVQGVKVCQAVFLYANTQHCHQVYFEKGALALRG